MKRLFHSLLFRIHLVLVAIVLVSLLTLASGTYNIVSDLLLKETRQSINYTTEVLDRDINLMHEDIERLAKGMYANNEISMLVSSFPNFAHPQYVDNQISSYLYMRNILSTIPYIDSVYVYKDDQTALQYGIQGKKAESSLAALPQFDTISRLPALTQYWVPTRSPSDPPRKPRFLTVYMNFYDNSSMEKSGVLQINIELNHLFRILTNNVTGDRKFYVFTGDGQLIFGTDTTDIGAVMRQFDDTASGVSGDEHEVTLEDKSYHVSKYRSHYKDWYIINAVPTMEINQNSRKVLEFMSIYIGVAGTIIIALSVAISSRMLRPVKTLTHMLQALNFDKKSEWSLPGDIHALMKAPHEIGLFSRTFVKIMERLADYTEEIKQAAARQRNLELELLMSQIKPHFLYNTLESFCGLAKLQRTDDIYKLAKSLGAFYRISLSNGASVIRVDEELEHINSYLAIEKMKYNEKFDYHIELEEGLEACLILKLLLQPLVENAITHGIRHVEYRGYIAIRIQKIEESLQFLVYDNGIGMPAQKLQQLNQDTLISTGKGGFGIKNVRERIRLSYNDDYRLTYAAAAGGGTEVTVTLPLHRFAAN
ncbi:sensor histidine kinase [Paenibacillus thalictri]|uniref:Histidine kinase domain-containing protein n=1 Tax=Paenibacillus thalictri TaxID=2527873 RepID=A0A4Q9DR35_9BACL|nr:histidine kinase [Paenibacillus thalictri]TBL79097.1 hypothetical protein EYB31_12830 [Paenibacillus thalictri]